MRTEDLGMVTPMNPSTWLAEVGGLPVTEASVSDIPS